MFEQDYVMRLIKEMVRAVLKLLFGVDTEKPAKEMLESRESQQMLESIMDLVDEGKICEAENQVYEIVEEGGKDNIGIAIMFYSYLNDKTDDYLQDHNFSRDEIVAGLKDVLSDCGMGAMAEAFIQ